MSANEEEAQRGSCVTQLNRLIEHLGRSNIEFVIVGGFAGMLHGSTLLIPGTV
jgi:hypothetical protein